MNTNIWCVIPVYNNASTVKAVALGCRQQVEQVVVVDDGSTDADIAALLQGTDITVLRHVRNRGKGAALATGFDYVVSKGGLFAITIDADAQHDPKDISRLIPLLDDTTIIVGCRRFDCENVPEKSKFGRSFSNFWFTLETGLKLDDCQSGFRAYPLRYLKEIRCSGSFYDYETEIITRAAWAGLTVRSVEVSVWYAPKGQRISHFKPFKDNLRITLMHMRLVGRCLLPWPHKRLVPVNAAGSLKNLVRDPAAFIREQLKENATPQGLAASAAVGLLLAVLPLVSVHTPVIVYFTARLHLNKVMALSIQALAMPPLVPALCIELGYFMRHGRWFTETSFRGVFGNIPARLWDWFLGSLIVAPLMAILGGVVVYFFAQRIQSRRKRCVHG